MSAVDIVSVPVRGGLSTSTCIGTLRFDLVAIFMISANLVEGEVTRVELNEQLAYLSRFMYLNVMNPASFNLEICSLP